MRAIIVNFLLSFIWLGSCQDPKAGQTNLQLRLDSLITSEHSANQFGGTIVIGTNDTILFSKAIGIANRTWQIPMRLDHRFDICSINKSFISALILIAVEEGKLSLDDLLVDHLANYEYAGEFDPAITIHQMMSHISGLPDYDSVEPELLQNEGRLFKRKQFSNAAYVDFISQLPVKGAPEQQFYYSNFSYHLLAIILEDVYQMSFPELLENKIADPLGLHETFSSVSNTEVFERLTEAYNYKSASDSWERNQFIDLSLGRRIFSSAHDLYLWGKAMSGTSILSNESLALMTTNHVKTINPDISYGYGWAVFDGKKQYRMGDLGIDRRYIIHGGSTEGYKSMLINIESGQYIIAFLANTGDQTNELRLAQKIVNILISSENDQ